MSKHRSTRAPRRHLLACSIALALAFAQPAAWAQSTPPAEVTLDSIQVSGSWLGSGLHNSVQTFPGARTVVEREAIEESGAMSIGEVMRRIPGVQFTDNSGTAGSVISLNVGVR